MNLEEKLQHLQNQLDSLTGPKTQRKRKDLERAIANLKAFLEFTVGQAVTDGKQLGVISKLSLRSLSKGGMPEVWVSWDGKIPILETPSRLKPKPLPDEPVSSPASIVVEVSLNVDEQRDLLYLERKVERAFYEAGRALKEIRDRRLYRGSYQTFEEYVKNRFGMRQSRSYQLIDAAKVVDNLLTTVPPMVEVSESSSQQVPPMVELLDDSNKLPPMVEVLPTSERQVRPLTPLTSEEQRKAWEIAVRESGGKVPSSRAVINAVRQIREETEISIAHHLKLNPGGLVEILAPSNPKIHHRFGRIASVGESTVEVWLRDVDTMIMEKYRLKHKQVEPVHSEKHPHALDISQRIERLRELSLDPFDVEILNLLERVVALTPAELKYLSLIEEDYTS